MTYKRKGFGPDHITFPILIFIMGLFLALELSPSVYYFGWSGLSYVRVNSAKGLGVTGYVQPSLHDGVFFELRPNLDGYF